MLNSAHQGYYYQDILGAYVVALELASGNPKTAFHFDFKKTNENIPDKFDDLGIYKKNSTTFIQIKYSNGENKHTLTKNDFSSKSAYDLALFDLFKTWKALNKKGINWHICLAWDSPLPNDPILEVIKEVSDCHSILKDTTCYKFECNNLWPVGNGILSSWRALKINSKLINRSEFADFLNSLVIEVGFPKSTYLQDYSEGIERLLIRTIENIGIGVYPNDHLSPRQVAEGLCNLTRRRRSEKHSLPITCGEIANELNILLEYGGIEQKFPIDKNVLVSTPFRISQIETVLLKYNKIILTAEPGAGKSWFIENLENSVKKSTNVIKHYCYTALGDPLSLDRITVNVLYGSLISQIVESDESLGFHLPKRYASNLEQLNILLDKINKKTLLIIDGIDHIWRIYQKNRGGLTEDETTIIKALSNLKIENSLISLLIISQPIEEFKIFNNFFHCKLADFNQEFVKKLLKKNAVTDVKNEGISLSEIIYNKSKGNALYCKYLIDHSIQFKNDKSFNWLKVLPHYEFNLTSYYDYINKQINNVSVVPYVFCGADFSLTENELREITHLGDLVISQLASLKPILKYVPSLGYSIYHESFKRYLIDSIVKLGASIDHLIYNPIIQWLENHSFYKSTKAYGHLLKLYFETDNLFKIRETISLNFINASLYNAQPISIIKQNHLLQKASLIKADSFKTMIIVAEQSKIINDLIHINDQVFINYLKAVQKIHGDDIMYRMLWDGENLLVDNEAAFGFLVDQVYQKKDTIHWSILPEMKNISFDLLGLAAVKLIRTREYEKFDRLIEKVSKSEKPQALNIINNELEWYNIIFNNNWIENTPYYYRLINRINNNKNTIQDNINAIILNDRFTFDDTWKELLQNLIESARIAKEEELVVATESLSGYNWFRNWLIYLIKISFLAENRFNEEMLLEAFSFLVRNTKPFLGQPRTCDLYTQIPFIRMSFHKGLLLCNNKKSLLIQCSELLEKVTQTTTSLKGSSGGPLTPEAYLNIISYHLPANIVLDKYKEYYKPLGSKRVYSEVAEMAFEYSLILNNSNQIEKSEKKFIEGIQALTSYGYRKDRTLSEVLYSSVPIQETYKILSVEDFYELYEMATTVVSHTDGKSTSSYPNEWFDEFIKVYPEEALKFLISETLESETANWHQENQFYNVLKNQPQLFSPTNWFLLCRSIPIASIEKIISFGLTIVEQIDAPLRKVYKNWLKSLPLVMGSKEDSGYSKNLAIRFENVLGIPLSIEEKLPINHEDIDSQKFSISSFPKNSLNEALVFLEKNGPTENHKEDIIFLAKKLKWEEKKLLVFNISKKLRYNNSTAWLSSLFKQNSDEWMYMNICLFVFSTDGWFSKLSSPIYLEKTFNNNQNLCIDYLKEVLGKLFTEEQYFDRLSCNLMIALCKIKYDKSIVKDLFNTTFEIVKRRLPHPPNAKFNKVIYNGLIDFNQDEITVSLLIARLKTLTTEKTQNILWSLSYIAKNKPKQLIKPYIWIFSQAEHLLNVHRAMLLQILHEYVDKIYISDKLLAQLMKNYPTGYFLEDQYIRLLLSYNLNIELPSSNNIVMRKHKYDSGFFPYLHYKYGYVYGLLGHLDGTFNAYELKRDRINEQYKKYFMRSEKINTPIIPYSNATYEIINSQFYQQLSEFVTYFNHSETLSLEFLLPEIIIQTGAINKRPSSIPYPEKFPIFNIEETNSLLLYEDWVILASREEELRGKMFEKKDIYSSTRTISFIKNPNKDSFYFGEYIFKVNNYTNEGVLNVQYDQPICSLEIVDNLEKSSILFVTPWIVRELNLKLNENLHSGLEAINDKGDTIIKMINWKENYFGSIDDGTEVPGLKGVAVLIKKKYYNTLLKLYNTDGKFISFRNEIDSQ